MDRYQPSIKPSFIHEFNRFVKHNKRQNNYLNFFSTHFDICYEQEYKFLKWDATRPQQHALLKDQTLH